MDISKFHVMWFKIPPFLHHCQPSLPKGAVASPAGPSDPSSHSDVPPRGDATPGSGGIVVANGDEVTEDGNDDSVPMETIRVSHVEVPPEVTWVDKTNHLQVIYFFQYGRVQRNQGVFP